MTATLFLLTCTLLSPEDKIEEGLRAARKALDQNMPKECLERTKVVLQIDPKNVPAHLLLGQAHDHSDQHREAVQAYSRVLELDPNQVEVVDLRGSANFKAGRFAESAADFDRYVKLKPDRFNGHWRRGITLYYAGRFEDGKKQFEGYEKVDTNDVENAVWHFLCAARKDGVEKARAGILKIGRDRRVPMMTVYDLFRGAAKPEDVLKAVDAGEPNQAERGFRLFYAHLYLGLYHEVSGNAAKALEHLELSVKQPRVHPYMWDVARVHRDKLKEKKSE